MDVGSAEVAEQNDAAMWMGVGGRRREEGQHMQDISDASLLYA